MKAVKIAFATNAQCYDSSIKTLEKQDKSKGLCFEI